MLTGKRLQDYLAYTILGKKPPQSETKHRTTTPRKKRKGPPRKGPSRDEGYKGWIRTLPCCGCGIEGRSEAAHTGQDSGMSMKASDYSCVPLCADCHTQAPHAYHRIGRAAFERAHRLKFARIAAGLRRAWGENKLPNPIDNIQRIG